MLGVIISLIASGIALADVATYSEPLSPGYERLSISWVMPNYRYGVVVMTDDRLLQVSEYRGRVIDPNGTVVKELPGGYYFAVAPDGGLCISSQSNLTYLNPDLTVRWSVVGNTVANLAIGPNGSVSGVKTTWTNDDVFASVLSFDAQGQLMWEHNSSGRIGDVAVAEDGSVTFYTSGYDDLSGSLVCLNPNGSVRWSQDRPYNWGNVRVATDGERLYINGWHTSLGVLDLDGTPLWSLQGIYDASSPTMSDERLLVANGTSLICLDQNGTTFWTYTAPGWISSRTFTEDGGVVLTTGSELHFIGRDGELVKKAIVLWPEQEDGFLYGPMVAGDGRLYLLVDWAGYLVALGDGDVEPSITAKNDLFNAVLLATVGLAFATSAAFLYKAFRPGDARAPSRRKRWLLATSTGVRLFGFLVGMVAITMIWQMEPLMNANYFVGSAYGYHGLFSLHVLSSGAVLAVAGLLLSALTWYASYLALVGLLIYTRFLSELAHNNLLGQTDLTLGLPYGGGFILAWVAVVVLFISGLIRLYSSNDISSAVAWKWPNVGTEVKK